MKNLDIFALLLLIPTNINADIGYIWQLTDLHYDPTYWTTQDSCNRQIPREELGRFGHVECDSPWELVVSSIEALSDVEHTPDIIFWTGDSPPHAKDESNWNTELVLDVIQNCTELIQDTFPDTETYAIMGNHDFYPANDLPGHTTYIYTEMATMWDDWLNDATAKSTFTHASYYTLLSPSNDKLRIVALNTNLYLKSNQETQDQDDPGEQFAWFHDVMKEARTQQERVHILTHVPCGTLETDRGVRWIPEHFNIRLNALYRQYADVIIAIHSAHEHMDTFRMIYSDQGDAAAVMLIAPAVTPWRARVTPTIIKQARNPALRSIKYDKATLDILDIEQYFLNLTAANAADPHDAPEWQLEYAFSTAYGLDTVTAKSLASLLDDFKSADGTTPDSKFDRYYEYNTVKVDHPSVPKTCDCTCKHLHLCSVEFIEFAAYDVCAADDPCLGDGTSGAARGPFGVHVDVLLGTIIVAVISVVQLNAQ